MITEPEKVHFQISGIAVGSAAQDLLANLSGGLMIYLDRPFNAGDWKRIYL